MVRTSPSSCHRVRMVRSCRRAIACLAVSLRPTWESMQCHGVALDASVDANCAWDGREMSLARATDSFGFVGLVRFMAQNPRTAYRSFVVVAPIVFQLWWLRCVIVSPRSVHSCKVQASGDWCVSFMGPCEYRGFDRPVWPRLPVFVEFATLTIKRSFPFLFSKTSLRSIK
jgi:hypothetical protein